jgi:hypothetical protein
LRTLRSSRLSTILDARSSQSAKRARWGRGGGNERIKSREARMALETGPRFKIIRHEVVQPSRVSALDPKLVYELRPVPDWPWYAKTVIAVSSLFVRA